MFLKEFNICTIFNLLYNVVRMKPQCVTIQMKVEQHFKVVLFVFRQSFLPSNVR